MIFTADYIDQLFTVVYFKFSMLSYLNNELYMIYFFLFLKIKYNAILFRDEN